MAQSQTDADFNAAFFGTPSPVTPAQAPANDDAAFNAAFFGKASAPPSAGSATKAQPKNAEGAVGSAIRGAANMGSFGLGDLISAAGNATIPLDQGSSSAPSWSQRYHENLNSENAQTAQDSQDHPAAYFGGSLAGAIMNPVTRAIPAAKGLMGAVGQGAGIGAAYGLGSGLSDQHSQEQLGKDVVGNAAFGGLLPTVPAVAKASLKGAGYVGSGILGMTTGAGQGAIQEAYRAGRTGGEAATAFKGAMNGDSAWSDVVGQAKDALGNMRAERNSIYRSGMVDISKDPSVLSFKPIDAAFADASKVKSFKGQEISKSTAGVRSEIQSTIDHWKQLNPAEFHTPEGFDALKQQIGDIRDNLPYNSPQRLVADKAYNAVRQTISDQAPAYGKVMSGYAKASQQISDIEKELSLKPNANPATALRKLQSVMRNNAHTSWGERAKAADTLAEHGAGTILPSLAGQALSSPLPRGLAQLAAGGELNFGALAAVLGHPMVLAGAVPGLLASSPRLVGNLAYGAGAGARGLSALAPDLGPLTQRVGLGGFIGGLSPLAGPQPNAR